MLHGVPRSIEVGGHSFPGREDYLNHLKITDTDKELDKEACIAIQKDWHTRGQGVHQKTRELVLVYGSMSKQPYDLIRLTQQGRWGMMVNRKTGVLKIARIMPGKHILTYQAFKI